MFLMKFIQIIMNKNFQGMKLEKREDGFMIQNFSTRKIKLHQMEF